MLTFPFIKDRVLLSLFALVDHFPQCKDLDNNEHLAQTAAYVKVGRDVGENRCKIRISAQSIVFKDSKLVKDDQRVGGKAEHQQDKGKYVVGGQELGAVKFVLNNHSG